MPREFFFFFFQVITLSHVNKCIKEVLCSLCSCSRMSGIKTDVFPTRIDHPSTLKRMSKQPNLQAAVTNHEIFAFIIYLDKETIYYKTVDWNPRYQKHFIDTSAYIKQQSSYQEKPWDYAARKFRKDAGDNLRKNIDSRTCFKYDYNYFLVKGCFTFGQRKVQPGTSHLYQIGAVEMVLYFPNRRYLPRITKKDKIFPEEEQFYYLKRTLRANCCYIIPADTIYVLYAITKCYFSVHILKSEAEVPFHCSNPLEEVPPRPVDFIYKRPVPTPLIEEVVIGEEEDSTDDPVLITLSTGEDVTESMMMPPPPPPPRPPSPLLIPVERTVEVVTPDIVQWYQQQFKYKLYNEPKETIIDSSTNGYVLDLTVSVKNTGPPPASPSSPVPAASPPAPSNTPSPALSYAPSPAPSNAPSAAPSNVPSPAPSNAPSPAPQYAPSPAPSIAPSAAPSNAPSPAPSNAPSPALSYAPSPALSYAPSPAPSYAPSPAPSNIPSPALSYAPSASPAYTPSAAPQYAPSASPAYTPNPAPQYTPSASPAYTPSAAPQYTPSASPAYTPSPAPQYTPAPPPQMYTPSAAPSNPPSQPFAPAQSYEVPTPSYEAISPFNPAQSSSETISFREFLGTITPIDEQLLKDFFGNDFC